mgnify:CR=1 FL=1
MLMRKNGPNCEMKYSYSILAREVGGTHNSYGLLYNDVVIILGIDAMKDFSHGDIIH